MKILYIDHYAGAPKYGMEYRPYYLAQEWVRSGHNVRVVASSYSHVRSRQPQMGGKQRVEENIDGITYEWLAGPVYSGNGVGRAWGMLTFLRQLYRDGRRLARSFRPHVVIASSTYPMDIWPARRIARMAGAKLVYEVHDLWPLSPMELGDMSRWHPFIVWAQMAENFAYRNADRVVSILPNVHEHMVAHGLDLRRLTLVPNGVDPGEWDDVAGHLPEDVQKRLREIHLNHSAIVGYAGTHGIANALELLLSCAALLQNRDIAFVLVGDGPKKLELIAERQRRNIKNVYFFDPVPKQTVPELLHWFDVSIISWWSQPLYRFGVSPNKLFDYMMAARPVVQCINAPPGPVEHSGCGICVPSDDACEAAGAIERLLALSPEERRLMGQKGREYVLANHTYPVLAARFLSALNSNDV